MTTLVSRYLQPRRAWLVAMLLLLIGLLAIGAWGEAEKTPRPTDTLAEGSGSAKVAQLRDQLPQGEGSTAVVLYTADQGSLTPQTFEAAQASFAQQHARLTATGTAPAGPPPVLQRSEDGTAALGVIPTPNDEAAEDTALIKDLRTKLRAAAPAGTTVQVTGPAAFQADIASVFDGASLRLLLVTASVVAILLLVTYRSPILWLVPLICVAIADRLAVVTAGHLLNALSVAWDESTMGIVSVLVFGAGTDYALLLMSRYRDELRRTEDRYSAMREAVRHTAESVVASATTVVLGVLTFIFSLTPSLRGLGIASAIGIVIAAGYALVVLPCVLVLFGRGIFWPLIPRVGQQQLADTRSLWQRIGALVARRPGLIAAGCVLLLAALSLGGTQISSGLSPSDQFLKKPEAIAASERLAESFPAGTSEPTIVITRGDPAQVVQQAQTVPSVASARIGRQGDRLTEVSVVLTTPPGTDAAQQSIREVRSALAGIPDTWVGGSEAEALDSEDAAARDRLVIIPLILLLVLGALMLLLRSVVAPVLLVATVVATFFASLGLSWWVFTSVFDFSALDSDAALLAFLFLVALGVDYNIFLVSRAREEAQRSGDTRQAMLRALAATGGVITSAGILLAAVFIALGVLPLVALAQIGVIVCLGVLLDTLLVRTVLVPALALVLGDRFWWPRQLKERAR